MAFREKRQSVGVGCNGVAIHPFKVNVIVRGVGCDPFKVIPVISYLIDYGSRTITVSTEDVKL